MTTLYHPRMHMHTHTHTQNQTVDTLYTIYYSIHSYNTTHVCQLTEIYLQQSEGVTVLADDARHSDLLCTFLEKQTLSRRKNLVNVGTEKDRV